jgi:hypothetical protein
MAKDRGKKAAEAALQQATPERRRVATGQLQAQEESVKEQFRSLDNLEAIDQGTVKHLKTLQAVNEELRIQAKLQKQIFQQANGHWEAEIKATDAFIQAAERKNKQHEAGIEFIGKSNEHLGLTNSLVDKIGGTFGLSSSKAGGFIKQTMTAYSEMKKLKDANGSLAPGLEAASQMMKNLGKSVMSALNPMNIAETLMSKIWSASVEYFFKSSEAIANYNKIAGDLGTSSKAVGKAVNWSLGILPQHAGQAAGALASTLTSFTSMSLGTQTNLVRTSAELERVGVSASVTGGALNTMTKAMGMTASDAEKQWKDMAVMASSFGKTPGQFAADFTAASKVLMAQGPKMMDVFKDLEATAMASGLAMDKLLSVAGQFDTFDTAAQKVGNLNALLGGDYLNTLEMMDMTENERIETLKSSLDMAGKNFDTMSKYERMAIAEQMGMGTDELSQMMNADTAAARKAREEAEKKARQEKAYQRMVKQTMDIAESIRMLLNSLFVKTGLMKAFSRAFGALFKYLDPKTGTGKMVKTLTDSLGKLMETMINLGLDGIGGVVGEGGKFSTMIEKWTKQIGKWTDMLGEGKWKEVWVDIQKSLGEGIGDLTSFFDGPLIKPVQDAIGNMAKKPLGNILADFGQSLIDGSEGIFGGVDRAMGDKLKSMAQNFTGDIDDAAAKADTVAKTIASIETPKAPEGEGFFSGWFDGDEGEKMGADMAESMIEGIEDTKKGMALAGLSMMESFEKPFGAKTHSYENFINMGRSASESVFMGFEENVMNAQPLAVRLGDEVRKGFEDGLKPTAIENMMDRLIESTEKWAESMEKVASAVGQVAGAASGKPGAGAAAIGDGSTITFDLGDGNFADWVVRNIGGKLEGRLASL